MEGRRWSLDGGEPEGLDWFFRRVFAGYLLLLLLEEEASTVVVQ